MKMMGEYMLATCEAAINHLVGDADPTTEQEFYEQQFGLELSKILRPLFGEFGNFMNVCVSAEKNIDDSYVMDMLDKVVSVFFSIGEVLCVFEKAILGAEFNEPPNLDNKNFTEVMIELIEWIFKRVAAIEFHYTGNTIEDFVLELYSNSPEMLDKYFAYIIVLGTDEGISKFLEDIVTQFASHLMQRESEYSAPIIQIGVSSRG